MNRVAVYVRVSTAEQSLDLQLNELKAYAAARGWTSLSFYEDKASGTTQSRQELRRLLKDVRARRIDLVLVWKLDRLARSLRDLITMLQEFNELGVAFISLKDNIDLTTSAGRLMLHIIGAFAEFEAALIKERVVAGLQAARKRGVRLGRPKKRDDEAIRRLRQSGMSYREISRRLRISVGAIQRALPKGA